MDVLLDTDVIINILKKKEDTIEKFKFFINKKAKFYICAITIAEVYAGALQKEYSQIEKLFSFFSV